jgi:two-component system, NtrC family, sensor kinase
MEPNALTAELKTQLEVRTRELAETRKALAEALEQQTATSEVLQVISSSPGELEPVFQAMLENAVRLCEAKFGNLFLYEKDSFRIVAIHNAPRAYAERWRREPVAAVGDNLRLPLARLAGTKTVVHIPDLTLEPGYIGRDPRFVSLVDSSGMRTMLLVPMLKKGQLVGTIVIYRQEVRPFTDKQIELVQTFADQAAIAIENVRLFAAEQQRTRELTESLEQQTATAEILGVISNSLSDTQPVFDAIVQSGLKLFADAAIMVVLPDGDQLKAVAVAEPDPARAEALRRRFPIPLSREYMNGVAILDARVVDIPDAAKSPPELAAGTRNFLASGYRAVTNMPMMRGGVAVGCLSVSRRAVGPLSDKQLAVLKTFANQAVIAIENTRLLNELRESLEQQTATSEVLSVISSSPGELEPVFQAMLENATRICEAKFGTLFLCEGDAFRVASMRNAPLAYAEARTRVPIVRAYRDTAVWRAANAKRAAQVADVTKEQAFLEGDPFVVAAATLGGYRTVLAVPVRRKMCALSASHRRAADQRVAVSRSAHGARGRERDLPGFQAIHPVPLPRSCDPGRTDDPSPP